MDQKGANEAGTVESGNASNSSDFVRKLYQMLEDPSYAQVVRWTNDGNSFVVLENERFTKHILPKHFKHSNFASFVRQLNKYDFHKVRHNQEEGNEGAGATYGSGAWEFKHPDFRANNRHSLDSIRRKAPAARKVIQQTDEAATSERLDMLSGQLVATQQLLQQMEGRHQELNMHHGMVVQELIGVQKAVLNHERVMQNVMVFLRTLDAKQRQDGDRGDNMGMHSNTNTNDNSSNKMKTMYTTPQMPNNEIMGPGPSPGSTGNAMKTEGAPRQLGSISDDSSSPLQIASKLLSNLNADEQLNQKNLECLSNDINGRLASFMATPPSESMQFASPNSASHQQLAQPQQQQHQRLMYTSTSSASASAQSYPKFHQMHNDDSETIVYPVGQTNGIDPTFSEHIHNIPYGLPSKDADISESRNAGGAGRKKSVTTSDPGWMRSPQILLVEDDPTCRRIGGKFLYSFQCAIDNAFDGLEAVNKMNSGSKYDLVLMDIIMPNLDGVSACHLIRQFDNTPIIAMTSNIRSDDISMYFQHGMNDVLPKPFTKEGLLNMLEKHLAHLKRVIPGSQNFDQSIGPGENVSRSNLMNNLGSSGNNNQNNNNGSSHGSNSMGRSASALSLPSIASSIKDESSPIPTPSSLSNWQSPQFLPGVSPQSHDRPLQQHQLQQQSQCQNPQQSASSSAGSYGAQSNMSTSFSQHSQPSSATSMSFPASVHSRSHSQTHSNQNSVSSSLSYGLHMMQQHSQAQQQQQQPHHQQQQGPPHQATQTNGVNMGNFNPDQNSLSFQTTQGFLNGVPQMQAQTQRRQISDMGSSDAMNSTASKRQRVYDHQNVNLSSIHSGIRG